MTANITLSLDLSERFLPSIVRHMWFVQTGLEHSSVLRQDRADTRFQGGTSQILKSRITESLYEQLFKALPTRAVSVNASLTSAGQLRGESEAMSDEHMAASSEYRPDHESF